MELFDSYCRCFSFEKHSSPNNYYLTYLLKDFKKLATNIRYLIEEYGWEEKDESELDNSNIDRGSHESLAIYRLQIYVRPHDVEIEVDGRLPALLADEIRKVVKDFYND